METSTAWDTLRNAFQGVGPLNDPSNKSSFARSLANWDPAYPDEETDFYEEYIRRHAPINVAWLGIPSRGLADGPETCEATGVGFLEDPISGSARHVVAPLDDGSVCIWDIHPRETESQSTQGRIIGRSRTGLLTGSDNASQPLPMSHIKALMTETGAVESVSIDNNQQRGYFAQNNTMVEVDLSTLQTVSRETFPFPITALSSLHHHSLVVGTNNTMHIHDPRNKTRSTFDPTLTVEVIGGPTANHALLSQPGPLSIINSTEGDSIWVAGRFTHLLNYDRRFFPRLCSTMHSGARISCITTLPYPMRPRTMDLLQNYSSSMADLYAAKSAPGSTLLAAGEYKGKGSLEYYSLPAPSSRDSARHSYQNRQTASSTKLLSVACHGLSTVFSDGDGFLKWVERDGSTPIRKYNINETAESPSFNQAQSSAQLINGPDESQGDIVQKMIPLKFSQSSFPGQGRLDFNQSDLLLKTGDGRIGILGFGHESLYSRGEVDEVVESVAERAQKDAERSYQDSMGRLLQKQADELRWLRTLGMG